MKQEEKTESLLDKALAYWYSLEEYRYIVAIAAVLVVIAIIGLIMSIRASRREKTNAQKLMDLEEQEMQLEQQMFRDAFYTYGKYLVAWTFGSYIVYSCLIDRAITTPKDANNLVGMQTEADTRQLSEIYKIKALKDLAETVFHANTNSDAAVANELTPLEKKGTDKITFMSLTASDYMKSHNSVTGKDLVKTIYDKLHDAFTSSTAPSTDQLKSTFGLATADNSDLNNKFDQLPIISFMKGLMRTNLSDRDKDLAFANYLFGAKPDDTTGFANDKTELGKIMQNWLLVFDNSGDQDKLHSQTAYLPDRFMPTQHDLNDFGRATPANGDWSHVGINMGTIHGDPIGQSATSPTDAEQRAAGTNFVQEIATDQGQEAAAAFRLATVTNLFGTVPTTVRLNLDSRKTVYAGDDKTSSGVYDMVVNKLINNAKDRDGTLDYSIARYWENVKAAKTVTTVDAANNELAQLEWGFEIGKLDNTPSDSYKKLRETPFNARLIEQAYSYKNLGTSSYFNGDLVKDTTLYFQAPSWITDKDSGLTYWFKIIVKYFVLLPGVSVHALVAMISDFIASETGETVQATNHFKVDDKLKPLNIIGNKNGATAADQADDTASGTPGNTPGNTPSQSTSTASA